MTLQWQVSHMTQVTSRLLYIFLLFRCLFCCNTPSPPHRGRVLTLHPHGRVEEPDRRAVHAADGPHGGQLQGPGVHPGGGGLQRAEPAREGRHLLEPGRPPEGRRAELHLGWVKASVRDDANCFFFLSATVTEGKKKKKRNLFRCSCELRLSPGADGGGLLHPGGQGRRGHRGRHLPRYRTASSLAR